MIAQYESSRPQRPLQLQPNPAPQRVRHGRMYIGLMTAVYVCFLVALLWFRPQFPPLLHELVRLVQLAGGLTLALLWGVVWWQQRRATAVSPPPALDIATLYALSPADFEAYVAHLFRRKGYQVQLRGRSGDLGVDLVLISPQGKRAIVQCKRYRKQVGPDVVRELYGTLMHEQVAHAFLVTTADISDSARQWAQGKPITLVDGLALSQIAAALDSHR